MLNEQLVEEGIVTGIKSGIATIIVSSKDVCHECSAKLFCISKENDKRHLNAADSIGVKVGDRVMVSLGGKYLFNAAVLLYGIPLLLIISGILLGYFLFDKDTEIYSALLGALLTGFYYLALHGISQKEKSSKKFLPKIVSVEDVNHPHD